MKHFLLLIFVLISCCKDEECECKTEDNLDLYQTYWEGYFVKKDQGVENNVAIRIEFISTETGEYFVEGSLLEDLYSKNSIFRYKLKDKIISIDEGYMNLLIGRWWIVKYEKDELLLRRDMIENNFIYELRLTKKI